MELSITDDQAQEGRKDIYGWFCKYAHPGEGYDGLMVNTDGLDIPTIAAVPLIAYFREANVKHSCVTRGKTF